MSRRKHWAESFGVYGATVRVFEEKGRLFARIRGERIPERSWPDTDEDRARAKAWAQEQADLLKAEKPNAGDPVPTVARVFALYLDRESPRPLWALVTQQVVYRQLTYLVVIQSVVSAILGIGLRWQKLRRHGSLESASVPVA